MTYALQTLWYERARYFPGVLAVAFSAVLVGLQCGLLLGFISGVSVSIDHSNADVWVASHGVESVDQGQAIDEQHIAFLAGQPEVEQTEVFAQGRGIWVKPDGAADTCMIVGSWLSGNALGAVRDLTPELRVRLSEPGTIVVDESDLVRLGISGVGSVAYISDRRVRVVGVVRGIKGLASAYVFCSLRTARMLLYLPPDQAVFFLARCRTRADADAVVARLRSNKTLTAYTREGFSWASRMYWLTKSKAGLALGWTAILGLLVGAVITGQTLYAATAANLREYAVLRAMGIARWHMVSAVGQQSFWVGLAGVLVSLPTVFGLAGLAELSGIRMLLPIWLLTGMVVVTLTVALLSGLAALRLLLTVDPALLLR